MGYITGQSPHIVDTLQGMGTRTGNAPEPATAPTVALPRAGEKFSDDELHRRFGVPTEHRIRVSRENKCIALVHLARHPPGVHETQTSALAYRTWVKIPTAKVFRTRKCRAVTLP